MKRCIAFIEDGSSPSAWRQCRRAARLRSTFCRQHEGLIAGVVLGICVHDFPLEVPPRSRQSLADMPVASRVPS